MTALNPQLIEQLKRHEGFRAEPYRCTADRLTVGYGHNLETGPLEVPAVGLTEEQAEEILLEDTLNVAKACAGGIPCWFNLNEARQGVLINMGFNLGMRGLFKFKHMLVKLEQATNGDETFLAVAEEMLDSQWAEQVKGRADELAAQMASGEWGEA